MLLAGCAQDDTTSGSAPASEQGASQDTPVLQAPDTADTSTRLDSVVTTTNAGPNTGVGAATTASSGVGTATASASSAVESDAAVSGQPGATAPSPAGTGAENPTVNSNGVGNAGTSTPQNNGSNR